MSTEDTYSNVLDSIRDDLRSIAAPMQLLSQQVIDNGISDWPIYIAYIEACNLGRPAFPAGQYDLNWSYNASLLEEFISRDVVQAEKAAEFRKAMGDPLKRAAIFVISEVFANFVFVDYQEINSEA